MSEKNWHVTAYRNAGLKYRVRRLKWADFAGACWTLDTKTFWTRAGAERRAQELNNPRKDSHE